MPSPKPRIAVTLDHRTYAFIARYAELQNITKAKCAADLLTAVTPFMEPTIDTLEKAKDAPKELQERILSAFMGMAEDIERVINDRSQTDIFGPKH